MTGGRPRTAIGTYVAIYVRRNLDRCVAETRSCDLDGRLRKVTATSGSPSAARAVLTERLVVRPGYGNGGVLTLSSGERACGPLILRPVTGKPIDRRDAYRMVARMAKGAGIPTHISLHSLRHAAITNARDAGVHCKTRRSWPGTPTPGPPSTTTGRRTSIATASTSSPPP